LRSLPDKSLPAFLPVSLCEPYLRLMEKPGYDPFKNVIELPQWRRQWILWRASGRWG
jgi:15-cis-phytoene synthase